MAGCSVQLQRHKEMEYRSLEHKIRDLWIAEANRNTEIRRKVANVGRPEDNVKDETSKLGKQGEIQRKIVHEAADDDIGNKESDSKKKPKSTNMDDMDAKTIKGGKTEVDTEPKTDDSTENSSDESKKAKKATNQENKKIGAKGVKEETMTEKLTFGSPQSLINSIAEAMKAMKGICPKCKKAKCMCEGWKEETELEEKLVGGQKKLDKNHNGKLDKQDFKMLRGKKMEEEAIDEVLDTPMKKLGYIAKNAYQVATADPAKMANDPKKANAIANRVIGAKRFQKKLNKEEVESIEELSKDTMKSYVKKVDKKGEGDKRGEGLGMASKKIAKKETDRTLQRAVNKIGNTPMSQTKASDGHKYDASRQELKNRGTHNFAGRRTKYEETDPGFSEAEIARIEEIANNIDEVVTARKLTAADKAARAKYLEGHAAKMAGMAHHAIKGDAKSFKARNTEHGDYSKEPSKMAGIGLDHTLTKQDTKR
jgi:hypothetical protein